MFMSFLYISPMSQLLAMGARSYACVSLAYILYIANLDFVIFPMTYQLLAM